MEIRGKPDELDRVAHVIGVPICRPTDRSSHDSSLEEPGFEPLVPRDTTKFSTPAHHFCLTPCTRKSRRERQPTPRGCRAPPAEPMVRILFPPAASRTNFELILQTLARYPLPDGISGLGGGGCNSGFTW